MACGGALRRAAMMIAVLPLSFPAPAAATQPDSDAPPYPTSSEAILDLLSEEQRDRLMAEGWLLHDTPGIEDADFDGVEALVIFQRPRSRVLSMLADTDRQREYRPELRKVETVHSYSDGSIDEHHMRILFVKIVIRIRYRADIEASRMTWGLDCEFENGLDELEGFWELYEYGNGRTLARFGTEVRVGPALPAFVQDLVTRKKLPANIESTRQWVDSDGGARR